MSAYKPKTQTIDAGSYCFRITTLQDGSIAASILHVSAKRGGIDTVAYLEGLADAPDGLRLFSAADAYDATNFVQIAPGGGRPGTRQNG